MKASDNLPPGVTPRDIDALSGPSMDECPDCEGEGKLFVSNCCDAPFAEPGYPDNDLCSKCHEHSEPVKCERCDGTGEIDGAKEAEDRRIAAEEDKADRDRDEHR